MQTLDVLIMPMGGGGLLSGCALAARALQPKCKIYGVEPEAGNDGQQSFRSGAIVRIPTPNTIADGAQTQALGIHTFPIIKQLADDIVTVSDADRGSAGTVDASGTVADSDLVSSSWTLVTGWSAGLSAGACCVLSPSGAPGVGSSGGGAVTGAMLLGVM